MRLARIPSVAFNRSICGFAISFPLVLSCVTVLIPWSQENVIIDNKGCARLTEYGLTPINSDARFTTVASPGYVGNSRWLTPEIINPARKGTAMESKAADVFAFAMLAVEVFTGEPLFGERKNEAVALRISAEQRPEMPENAQEIGLTAEIWGILKSCWQSSPKKRPMMGDVVRRWGESLFSENIDDSNPQYAQFAPVVQRPPVLNYLWSIQGATS